MLSKQPGCGAFSLLLSLFVPRVLCPLHLKTTAVTSAEREVKLCDAQECIKVDFF